MSDDQPRRKRPKPPLVVVAHDPTPEDEAWAKSIDFDKALGNSYVVRQVLDELDEPRHRHRRDLLGVILGLIEHLTPEQRRALEEKLRPAAVS